MIGLLNGKNIVVGITGGISAYKSVDYISKIIKKGANVKVTMTKSAEEFITPMTLQTISKNLVYRDMFSLDNWEVEHIELAKWADLIIIIPATANIIGKLAGGICDDTVTTVIMASKCKKIIAPAMNTNMYENNILKRNIDILKTEGYVFIDPEEGLLACGDIGAGKLRDIDDVVEITENVISDKKDLLGENIIVTAGSTNIKIDPVRYITNNSSGKMGYEIARMALRRGANVILVSGLTSLKAPIGVEFISVETTEEMYVEVEKNLKEDSILIKAAAPSDFEYNNYSDEKIKKTLGELVIKLDIGKDILKTLGENKKESQIFIGFAAESQNLVENGLKKLKEKNLDLIVGNNIKDTTIGFKSDYNEVFFIKKEDVKHIEKMLKSDIAEKILDEVAVLIEEKI